MDQPGTILSEMEQPDDGSGAEMASHGAEMVSHGVEMVGQRVVISPGLSQYFIPNCESYLKPFVGQKFSNLEEGIKFYERYAGVSGFSTRLGSTKRDPRGDLLWKYIYCNREGEKNVSPAVVAGSSDCQNKKRRRVSKRHFCKALVAFRCCGNDGYVVKRFEERHSHCLSTESSKLFLKVNRNLDLGHQKFIINCARANIGPVKSYRLFKEVVGGYSNIGCTSVDFKNFSRDLKAFALGVDAQMLLDKLFRKRELCSAFAFEYDIDEKEHLSRLFWADPMMRRNYAIFGDAVSFDATYSTNRYEMQFVPFTGKDNHGRCVTFAAGLISKEDADSYIWVFEQFKKIMGNSPKIFITDQDLGIKAAVEHSFPGTVHRFCMWHIMLKVPEKVPHRLKKNELFFKKLDSAVWSELLEPEQFEEKWDDIMVEYDLIDNSWFSSMFDIRRSWIPAYFRDIPMGGLFRTTSLSESENCFFGRYLNARSNLLEFFMHFDSAIDAQRHAQDQLNSKDEFTTPELKTPLLIEKHASSVYTSKIFLEVQDEINAACFECRVVSIKQDCGFSMYEIDDCLNGVCIVSHNITDNIISCSCKKFPRVGLLCRHIFVLLKDLKLESIPDKYIVSRWTKFAALKPIFHIDGDIIEQCVILEERKVIMSNLYSEFYCCLGLVEGDTDLMSKFLLSIREHKEALQGANNSESAISCKRQLFEKYYGTSAPKDVCVLPPLPVKTKGSGSRIKSRKEKAIRQSQKPLRLCRKCKQMTNNHDSRNCDKINREQVDVQN